MKTIQTSVLFFLLSAGLLSAFDYTPQSFLKYSKTLGKDRSIVAVKVIRRVEGALEVQLLENLKGHKISKSKFRIYPGEWNASWIKRNIKDGQSWVLRLCYWPDHKKKGTVPYAIPSTECFALRYSENWVSGQITEWNDDGKKQKMRYDVFKILLKKR